MRRSLAEGAVWACMVGAGEIFFVSDAVRLQASALALAFIAALPLAIGGTAAMTSLVWLRIFPRRRPIVVVAALVQAAALGSLAILEFTAQSSPARLIALACVYQAAGQTAGVVWSSWMGDLVPSSQRGRYFSRRNAVQHLATCASALLSGAVLSLGGPATPTAGGGGKAFALIFSLACVYRLVSAALLSQTPEGSHRGLPDRTTISRYVRSGRGRTALRLVSLGALLHMSVYIAAPYFTPYMFEALHFTYAQYTLTSVWIVVWKAIFLQFWGGRVDRNGARPVFGIAVVLIGIVPLPWVIAKGLVWILAAQMLSAFAWTGHEISNFTLLLDSSTRRVRSLLFAAMAFMNGTAQLLGGLVAVLLLAHYSPQYTRLFAVSAALRLVVGLLVIAWLPRDFRSRPRPRALWFTGWRPHGGIGLRPLPQRPRPREDEV